MQNINAEYLSMKHKHPYKLLHSLMFEALHRFVH